MKVRVNRFGVLGTLGAIGLWTNEPALYALFGLFALFASDRTVTIPTGRGKTSGR